MCLKEGEACRDVYMCKTISLLPSWRISYKMFLIPKWQNRMAASISPSENRVYQYKRWHHVKARTQEPVTPWTKTLRPPILSHIHGHTSLFLMPSICFESESESEVTQSCLTLCNPMDCAYQASPSMGFSRQEYQSGLLFPSPFALF